MDGLTHTKELLNLFCIVYIILSFIKGFHATYIYVYIRDVHADIEPTISHVCRH